MSEHAEPATVAESLHLAGDLQPADLERILSRWGKLDARLRSFPTGTVDLQLSLKERDTLSQRLALEARVPGHHHLVATSQRTDLDEALNEVRDEMVRQLTDTMTRGTPRSGH